MLHLFPFCSVIIQLINVRVDNSVWTQLPLNAIRGRGASQTGAFVMILRLIPVKTNRHVNIHPRAQQIAMR